MNHRKNKDYRWKKLLRISFEYVLTEIKIKVQDYQ